MARLSDGCFRRFAHPPMLLNAPPAGSLTTNGRLPFWSNRGELWPTGTCRSTPSGRSIVAELGRAAPGRAPLPDQRGRPANLLGGAAPPARGRGPGQLPARAARLPGRPHGRAPLRVSSARRGGLAAAHEKDRWLVDRNRQLVLEATTVVEDGRHGGLRSGLLRRVHAKDAHVDAIRIHVDVGQRSGLSAF